MTDVRAGQILRDLPDGRFLLRIKFLCEVEDEDEEAGWIIEDKFIPVRSKQINILEITKNTRPGALTGIDKVYYINAYPVTVVIYGLYPIREPDQTRLAPLRDGDLNCIANRVI